LAFWTGIRTGISKALKGGFDFLGADGRASADMISTALVYGEEDKIEWYCIQDLGS